MPPLSYSLLTDVLQYTPDKPAVIQGPKLPEDQNNQVYQNTNIVRSNPSVIRRMVENFGNETDITPQAKQIQLMEEQVFLSKLILLLLGFMLIVSILEKK